MAQRRRSRRARIAAVASMTVLLAVGSLAVPVAVLGQSDDDAGIHQGRIFFTSDRGTDGLDIWVLEAGAAEPVQLTAGSNVDWRPVASPDGSEVLFMSDRDGNPSRNSPNLRGYYLYTVGADGSDEQEFFGRIPYNATGGWSPDGSQIAVQSDHSGSHQIHVVPADYAGGSTPPPLTDDPGSAARPAWSPDGQHIVFDSSRHGQNEDGTENREIYLINVTSLEETRLTDHPARDMEAEWSPDGSRIAFQSDRDGNDEIYVMSADGSDLRRLTDDSAYDASPTWSPDGTMLAFESKRDGDFEIYVMSADGSDQRNLTHNPANGPEFPGQDSFPFWAP